MFRFGNTLLKNFSQDIVNFRKILQSDPAYGVFKVNGFIIKGNLSSVDNEDNNLLHIALQEKHKSASAALFLQNYSHFHQKNQSGKTPLDIIREDPHSYSKLFEGILLPKEVIDILGDNLEMRGNMNNGVE